MGAAVYAVAAQVRTPEQMLAVGLVAYPRGNLPALLGLIASWPRLGFDGTVMNCHDDSQRSNRLAVTVGHLRVVDRVVASIASLPRLGWGSTDR